MKFMKLGSKPDAFQGDGTNVRYLASELATDVIVNVGEVKFYLHKFPLISKCNRLQALLFKANVDSTDEIYLPDFPGGPKAFEICTKFCYGMTVILNPYNVVTIRCAAGYLEMTEDIEKGNLIFKIEVFLNSTVFQSWKDSIIVLQATKSLLPWSEDLKVVGRCIESIVAKASVDPSNVNWAYTYNKKLTASNQMPKDWWVEDLCELELSLYKKVMVALVAKGRLSSYVIGGALKAYTVRWLPDSLDALVSDDHIRRNRSLIETIIWLLPSDKDSGCSCNFLLKLLKLGILVRARDSLKENLMDRISMQLDEASLKDLLITRISEGDTVYDVHLVQNLVKRYMTRDGRTHGLEYAERSGGRTEELVLGRGSLLNLGKLVDGYLAEIGRDPNLPLSTFIDLSISIPEAARPIHDGLYKAIDIYLQEHPILTKEEKKRACGLINVRKLSTDACIHATHNDWLPLRFVVRVLFFEQLRLLTPNAEIASRTEPGPYKSQKKELVSVKKIEDGYQNSEGRKSSIKNGKSGVGGLLSRSRSRRILDKFWVTKVQGENKNSEISGRSQSPLGLVNIREAKSSFSFSRHRRHSIS